ncbi:MAG TPA: NrfD/PsrC family molybdoenzyme membrane anchor subunit [Chloroflexota bacterium]|nr:NrfD/PsrC family molybdoenzyme membrane anchor subunit [Chloroflexota bacterium]
MNPHASLPSPAAGTAHELEERLMPSLLAPGRWFRLAAIPLALVVAWGAFAWTIQLRDGLGATGLHNRMPWGVYIVGFVFLIGASYGGTLTSAILRLTGAEWRRPIVRLAEVSTVALLLVGAVMPLIDLGRPDRVINLFLYGPARLSSPVVWDLLAVGTYVTASLLYLYVSLIPDLALLRDRIGPQAPPLQRAMYWILAAGWRGGAAQRAALERATATMAIVIIPIAVLAHTALSFIFSMTLRPGWHSSIFGPYFVVGAIFSGVGVIVIAMAIFRRLYRLEPWITAGHFRKLGLLLLALDLLYVYFTLADYLTMGYQAEHAEAHLLADLFGGAYAPMFWIFVVGGVIAPTVLLALPVTRTIAGVTAAAVLANAGMWLKRYIIVVPSQAIAQTPVEADIAYQATWVEWSIIAGALAAVALIFLGFCRYFPIVSISEVAEGEEVAEAAAQLALRRARAAEDAPPPRWLPAPAVPRPALVPTAAFALEGGDSDD